LAKIDSVFAMSIICMSPILSNMSSQLPDPNPSIQSCNQLYNVPYIE
jgi:hypothetical protein